MKKVFTAMVAAMALTAFFGCGTSRTIERADKKKEKAEMERDEVKDLNQLLKHALGNIFVTSNHVWSIPRLAESYDGAVKICNEIGYELANEDNLKEFKDEILKDDAEEEAKIFYINDGKNKDRGAKFALCRKEPSKLPIEELIK